jgi:acetyltransferase-like isoleucine patch superfamily enzyme
MVQVVYFLRIVVKKMIYVPLLIIFKINISKKRVKFLEGSRIDLKCTFEGHNVIGENSELLNCSIGEGSYISRGTSLRRVKVGRYCSIGSNISNTAGRHPTSLFVSTHPCFFSENKVAGFTFAEEQLFKELNFIDESHLVSIGNDVWIGDNVTILDGVTIGDGVIVGANSLVTKDLMPYSINMGTPAKLIRYRFEPSIIDLLLKYKWWNNGFDWIKKNKIYFTDISEFTKEIINSETQNNA